jgi:hypothetical protein
MSLTDLILSRRSIRSYEKKNIPEDVLNQILEAGRQEPSATNRQPIRFVLVNDQEILKKNMLQPDHKLRQGSPATIAGYADVKSFLIGKCAGVDATITM